MKNLVSKCSADKQSLATPNLELKGPDVDDSWMKLQHTS